MGGANPVGGTKLAVGGKVTYFCRPGYIIKGSSTAICKVTGLFSLPMPTCQTGL